MTRRRSRANLGVASDHLRLEHVTAAKALRRERVGVLRPVPEPDVQIRCLDDFDTALGLDGGVA